MTIRIKPIKDEKRVIVGMTREIHRHRQGIENGLYVIGEIVGKRNNQLIKNGPKTGRIYRIGGRDHQASASGEAPANLTGKLADSYNFKVHGPLRMTVGQTAPYAGFLEDGTRNIEPRPNLIRAIQETQGDAVNVFYDEVDKLVKK